MKTVTAVGTVSFLVVVFKDRFSIFPFKTYQAETAVTAEKVPLDLQDLRENRVPHSGISGVPGTPGMPGKSGTPGRKGKI